MSAHPPGHTLDLFNRFIARSMGLHYREARLAELAMKISIASREFGFDDPEACMLWLMSSPLSREQLETLARSLTIGETYFLRDRQSYQALEEHVLPELIDSRRNGEKCIRIWSAGCSSGEEPYSIAILLSRILPDLERWNIMLLATDINPHALERGRLGVYSQWSFRDAPPWLMDYFTKRQDGKYEIIRRIRKMVQFSYLNLAEDSYPSLLNNTNAIDIIFCRNVMLYFEPALIEMVTARFHRALRDGGWLFVSPTEVAHRSFDGFMCRRFPGALAYEKGCEDKIRIRHLPAAPLPSATDTAACGVHLPVASPPPVHLTPATSEGVESQATADGTPLLDAFQEACELYREGSYEQAADKAREFLSSGVRSADAMELLARAYANLGRFAEARRSCEEAIAADRLRAHTHYLLSIILQEQGHPEEAAAALNRTLYIDHDFLLAYFALGNLHLQRGRKKEAQRNFANALRLLESRDPHEILPDAEGMTAGRLVEIIRAMT
jgi:chemotaxis protein methyltransferase CheR